MNMFKKGMSVGKIKKVRADSMQKMLAFTSLAMLMIFFSFGSPNFFQTDNLVAIMLSTAVNGVLAIAVTFVIITAGIDLSLGFVMTFSAVMAGIFITNLGLPIWIGVLGALATGTLCGALSGVMIAKMKIAPFIATLGMMMFTKGISLIISGTKPIYFSKTPEYSSISMDSVMGSFFPWLPIPNAVVVFFIVALIASFILNKTILGRYTFALGSNEEAIRLSGVNVDKWKITVYALCGFLCGIAGILMSSRLNSAQPALGGGAELDAIAAAVIGGASLNGGAGTILGTVIGAFIISVLTNGLRIMSIRQEWQIVATGIIIIFAVYMDILRRKK